MRVVELNNICKDFGDNPASQNVCFDLDEGEIHALLGENGAGKTTLMNILYGIYSCDSGEIFIGDRKVNINTPRDAINNGIGMVHQHFMLIPQLTVTQNIFLGMKEAGFFLNMEELHHQVQDLNDRFGFNVNPKTPVWQLPVGVQQKVEILKVLIRKAKILILDEPTAVLTPYEVMEWFGSIRKLAKEGYSVILITHKIEEVLKYCDRVTVMREGRVVGTKPVAETDLNDLACMMIGRSVFLQRDMQETRPGEVLLRVDKLNVRDNKGLLAVKDVSFEVRGGEILGVAGVDGNGQLELGEALVGLRRFDAGSIAICGETKTDITPRRMMDAGISHIPDDRHKKGLVLPFTIQENLILGSQRDPKFHAGPMMNYDTVEREARKLVERFDVRPPKTGLTASKLSGGNQQKVILARELSRNPQVLVALQPTRGLDIGAIEFVRKQIVNERDKGKAVFLVSTDLDEILSISDRIAVMFKGEILDIVSPDTPVEQISLLMGGVKASIRSAKQAFEEVQHEG